MEKRKILVVYLLLTMAGFITGVLLFQFVGNDRTETGGLFSYEWISRFLYTEIDRTGFFVFCLKRRLLLLLILLLTSLSILAYPACFFYCFVTGLVAGMQLSLSVACLGWKGPVIFFFTTFPQALFYIPSFVSYLLYNIRLRRKEAIRYYIMVAAFLFTIGVFLESYVNPVFLHEMLKKIY